MNPRSGGAIGYRNRRCSFCFHSINPFNFLTTWIPNAEYIDVDTRRWMLKGASTCELTRAERLDVISVLSEPAELRYQCSQPHGCCRRLRTCRRPRKRWLSSDKYCYRSDAWSR